MELSVNQMSKTKVRPILGSAHLWFYAAIQLIGNAFVLQKSPLLDELFAFSG